MCHACQQGHLHQLCCPCRRVLHPGRQQQHQITLGGHSNARTPHSSVHAAAQRPPCDACCLQVSPKQHQYLGQFLPQQRQPRPSAKPFLPCQQPTPRPTALRGSSAAAYRLQQLHQANVLLLLGNVNKSGAVVIRESSSSSNVRNGDSSSVTAAATAPASALHGSARGCPPNAPARRRPPVLLLPAEELPGLLLAA